MNIVDRNDAPENHIAQISPICCRGCIYYVEDGIIISETIDSNCIRRGRKVFCKIIDKMKYRMICSPLDRKDKCSVIFVKGWVYKHGGD